MSTLPPRSLQRLRRLKSRGITITITLVVCVIGLTAVWMDTRKTDPLRADLVRLVAAMGSQRRLEPRLTGGFAYGPVSQPLRSSAADDIGGEHFALLAALAELQGAAEHRRLNSNLHAWGIGQAIAGRFDEAIETLEEVVRSPSPISSSACDLGAVYLARARGPAASTRGADLPKGIEAIERGIRLANDVPECWFNRALAFEYLGLRDAAVHAWQDYLTREREPDWSEEARQHLRRLRAPSVPAWKRQRETVGDAIIANELTAWTALSPQHAREYLDVQLLGAWGDAIIAGHSRRAEQLLAQATTILTALPPAARALTQASIHLIKSSNNTSRLALASAHRLFRDAVTQFETDRIADSQELFEQSAALFSRAASPFALWCRLYSAQVSFYRGQMNVAISAAEMLRNEVSGRYQVVELRVQWMLGLIHAVRGAYSLAGASYERALEIATSLREDDSSVFLRSLRAEQLDFIGRTDLAWQYRLDAVNGIASVASPRRRHSILVSAAQAAARQRFGELALQLQNSAVRSADELGMNSARFEAHLYRARIFGLLDRSSEAHSDVQAAEALSSQVPEALGPRYKAEVAVTLAALGESPAPRKFAEALDYFRQSGANARVAVLEHSRALAALANGEDRVAEFAFRAAIAQATARAKELAPSNRLSYADDTWDIFRDAAIFFINSERPVEAIAVSEIGRQRLSKISLQASPPSLQLPAHTSVAYFFTGRESIYVAILRDGLTRVFSMRITPLELTRRVARLRGDLVRDTEQATTTLADLFDLLVADWIRIIPEGESLVIIPDGALCYTPFHALLNRRDGRFLIERNPITSSSSLEALHRPAAISPHASLSSVLAVSVSSSPSWGTLRLAALPSAEQEVSAVIGLYRYSRLLAGADATPMEFIRQAPSYDVVHFAGHSSANPQYPELSWIALWPDPSSPEGFLFGADIARMRLRAHVVFLSSCDSSSGFASRSEGVLSIARSMLDAGARTVIGAAWQISDQSGRQMAESFHRALTNGLKPSHALQFAQLEALRGGGETARLGAWTAFAAYGAP